MYYFNVPTIQYVSHNKTDTKMELSNIGINLIKKWEGLYLTSYICPGGKITIGWGSTFDTKNKSIKLNTKITKEQAEEYLQHELNLVKENILNYNLKLNQNQFDALASLVYNIGQNSFKRSTLLRYLIKEDYINASKEFVKWNKIKKNGIKVALKGLTNRRLDETKLFNTIVMELDI